MSSSPQTPQGSTSSQTEDEKRIAEVWQSYTVWCGSLMQKERNFGGDIVDSMQTGEHDIRSRGVIGLKGLVFQQRNSRLTSFGR
jgi:hypothetical protein